MKGYLETILKAINTKRGKVFLLLFFVLFFIGIFFLFFRTQGKQETERQEITLKKEITYPQKLELSENLEKPISSASLSIYHKENGEKVLFEENSNEVFSIASISKLMTAMVVFENYKLEEATKITEEEIISRTEFRDFRAWEGTKIEEMVYPLLIESNNSAAFALALISDRFLETKEEPVIGFVNKMNEKAKEIGMQDTQFINPSGLDSKNKYNSSTAKDIARLLQYIIKNNEKLLEISIIPHYKIYSPDGLAYYEITNTNMLLHSKEKDWQEDIIGGKTGWTHSANGCLVLVLESPDKKGYIVNVILGAQDRFKEMKKLVEYVFAKYTF